MIILKCVIMFADEVVENATVTGSGLTSGFRQMYD